MASPKSMKGIAGIISSCDSADDVDSYARDFISAFELETSDQIAPGAGLSKLYVRFLGETKQFGTSAIALHGKIHNVDDVAKKLRLHSDFESPLEIVYSAFRAWGEDCAKEFLGDFVFCIWDSHEQNLFCVRDALGVRPLYYAWSDHRIAFSTSFSSLRALSWVSRQIDQASVAFFLQGSMNDRQSTVLRDIKRLPAASSLIGGLKSQPRIRQYWRFSDIKPLEERSNEAYVSEFRGLFEDAIRCRLCPSTPVAAELSGGLDSSSVFAVARSISAADVQPYSATFPQHSECDESAYIDAVSNHYGTASRKLPADGSGFLDLFTESLRTFGGLHNAANVHISLRILKAVRSDGFSAILNGVDGDNVVSHGRSRLFEIASAGDWLSFSKTTEAIAPCFSAYSDEPGKMLARQFGSPAVTSQFKDGNFARALLGALVLRVKFGIHSSLSIRAALSRFQPRKRGAFSRTKSGFWRGRFEKEWFPERFINESGLDTPEFWANFGSPDNRLEERSFHIASLNSGINQHYFEYIHSISSAYGIENLSPFMDRRLVEYCIGLPASAKLRNGYTRAVLRSAMKGYLPDILLQRKVKANLGAASIAGFRRECLPWLLEFLRNDADLIAPFIEISPARSLANQVARGEEEGRGAITKLWIIFCLARWAWVHRT